MRDEDKLRKIERRINKHLRVAFKNDPSASEEWTKYLKCHEAEEEEEIWEEAEELERPPNGYIHNKLPFRVKKVEDSEDDED